jgi:hypothetical protein
MPKPLNFLSLLTGCFAYPAAENPTVAMVDSQSVKTTEAGGPKG